VLRGRPVFLPGTVNTIAGPVGMPNFCIAFTILFIGFR
jgi:hypothetical protein